MAALEQQQPFDLEHGPVVRASLLHLSDEDHVLLATMHHIVSDGWSMGVLLRELGVCYEAFSCGEQPALTPLEIDYADFSVWQREWLQGEVLQRQLQYWQQKLDAAPALVLPTDFPRPRQQSFVGAAVDRELPTETCDRLREFNASQGCTLFMTLLTAFQALLSRFSGQTDFVVGSPIANRNRTEIEGLVGFFVNSLALRCDLTDDPSFLQATARGRELAREAYAHQDLPFERLVEELQPDRDLSRNPLFQVMFAVQNARLDPLELSDLEVGSFDPEVRTTRFDLECHVWDQPSGLRIDVFYNTDLFRRETIAGLLESYLQLMSSALLDPEQPISRLSLVADSEHPRLLQSLAPPASPVDDRSVAQLFAEQVRRCPQQIAVCQGDRQWTYAQLEQDANQLAAWLRQAGVSEGTPVALLLDRCYELVLAMTAVLKAGGVYAPLDAADPDTRLQQLLSDLDTPLLISSDDRSLAEFTGQHLVLTDSPSARWRERIASEPDGVELTEGGQRPAYIMYTSGSTGSPKGVVVPHQAIVRLVRETDYVQLTPDDVVAQASHGAFDASTFEIWGALLNGARLVVVPKSVVLSPLRLGELLKDEQVSTLFLTTALFNQCVQQHPQAFAGLRHLLFAGEKVQPQWVRRLLEHSPPQRLLHVYGPTENTTFSTWYEVEEVAEGARTVPIGQSIANSQAYVLDGALRPVPAGMVGELYLGGAGLALGYWNQEALTSERFITAPWNGDRLYRTGDLVRVLEQGQLEFIGRRDQQVKIRGFRVELSEIEACLHDHPAVLQAAVTARPTHEGHLQLAAYVVPQFDDQVTERAHQNARQQHLNHWLSLHQDTYASAAAPNEADFHTAGWNSSYSGQPIESQAMREWVETTVARIETFRPQRVLEIGCGSGLLLLRLASQCKEYVGTDFSQQAVDDLTTVLQQRDWGHVQLRHQWADDFRGLACDSFDTVILNSVVQYFPDEDYLRKVLDGCLTCLADGGHLFVGDVRHLGLLETFHTSVVRSRSPNMSPEQMHAKIVQQVRQESELLIDPRFFAALQDKHSRIIEISVQPKRGQDPNEMTCYRYDAVLQVGQRSVDRQQDGGDWIDWLQAGWNVQQLTTALQNSQASFGIRGIPNARVSGAAAAWDDLQRRAAAGWQGSSFDPGTEGIDPEQICAMAEANGWRVRLSWLESDVQGRFDAVLWRGGEHPPMRFPQPAELAPLITYTNHPARRLAAQELIPMLREYLQQQLPAYMLPAHFMLVNDLPLNRNGKIDYAFLPKVDIDRPDLPQAYAAPRSPEEETIASVWSVLLEVEQVGIDDNFFELGGHSLLATQASSRLSDALQSEFDVRTLFEHPTVRQLAQWLADQELAVNVLPALTPAPRDQPLPLSYAQQRLWFVNQLVPNSGAYNIPLAFRIFGRLDEDALQAALNELVPRHAALRTRFSQDQVPAHQQIEPDGTLPLEHFDLSSLPEDQRLAEAQRLASLEQQQPFDLEHGPVVRASLLHLSDKDHVLLVTMHHIVSDGWSMGVLLRELGMCYEAFSCGEQPALTPLEIDYADFAVWQREWLQGEVLRKQLQYWRERLADSPALDLPTDFPRPRQQSFVGAAVDRELPTGTYNRLRDFNAAQGCTLFMTLLTGFQALLSRFSGQTDFVVGSPIANRNRTEIEGLVGLFVNSLALRCDLTDDPSFLEATARGRELALEAYAHQDLPFERLVEELQPDRDLSRNPLFQVMFAVQNARLDRLELSDLEVGSFDPEVRTTRFDLEWHVWDQPSGLRIDVFYNTDLFRRETIAGLLESYLQLISSALLDPEQPISRLSLVADSEHPRLLQSLAPPAAPVDGRSVAQLFAEQVRRSPQQIAVCQGDRQWTYAQLEQDANQLAAWLRQAGVREGTPVALLLDRCYELVLAMTAVLKAGGVYAPLDAADPDARLQQLLSDLDTPLLICSEDRPLPEFAGQQLVLTDSPSARWRESIVSRTHEFESIQGGQRPAYIMYTSGSTGSPKGVVVPHQAIVRLVRESDYVQMTADDVVAQASHGAFDASTFEIWGALLNGARLVVVPKSVVLSPLRLR